MRLAKSGCQYLLNVLKGAFLNGLYEYQGAALRELFP